MMKKQRGAAILVVLLILLVITVLGITAVRMGLTSLTIATNSQVSALLFQSADTGVVSFEQRVTANPAAAALPDGVIGPSLNAPGVETPYCFTKGDRLRAGGCVVGADGDFTSTRNAVLNQVAVEVPAAADGSPMRGVVLGTDLDRAGINSYRVNVYSTAVLPVFGAANEAELNECLSNRPNDDSEDPAGIDTVTDCLTDEGAVFTTMAQEYNYGYN